MVIVANVGVTTKKFGPHLSFGTIVLPNYFISIFFFKKAQTKINVLFFLFVFFCLFFCCCFFVSFNQFKHLYDSYKGNIQYSDIFSFFFFFFLFLNFFIVFHTLSTMKAQRMTVTERKRWRKDRYFCVHCFHCEQMTGKIIKFLTMVAAYTYPF